MKEVKKKRSMEKKHKVIESSKSLNNVRVVLKNLVFVIGLSPSLADPEVCVCACVCMCHYVEFPCMPGPCGADQVGCAADPSWCCEP